jgi:3-oxoacyl-[acyl-carrier protein] reductase
MHARDGTSVFVTGAAHGMGLAAATAFARAEYPVGLFDVDAERLAIAAGAVGAENAGRVRAHVGDVRSRADLEAALDDCEEHLGPAGVCVNHAGICPSTHILEITEEEWDEVIGVNLTGVFQVAQAVGRRMLERGGGVILNMSSSGAVAAEPGHAHYAASKAGILALTRAMAHDLGPHGVRTCALCPGDIETYEWPNVELARLYRSRIAAGRSGRAEEVVAVYLFLASEDARHLNGAAFIVDGGMLAWE